MQAVMQTTFNKTYRFLIDGKRIEALFDRLMQVLFASAVIVWLSLLMLLTVEFGNVDLVAANAFGIFMVCGLLGRYLLPKTPGVFFTAGLAFAMLTIIGMGLATGLVNVVHQHQPAPGVLLWALALPGGVFALGYAAAFTIIQYLVGAIFIDYPKPPIKLYQVEKSIGLSEDEIAVRMANKVSYRKIGWVYGVMLLLMLLAIPLSLVNVGASVAVFVCALITLCLVLFVLGRSGENDQQLIDMVMKRLVESELNPADFNKPIWQFYSDLYQMTPDETRQYRRATRAAVVSVCGLFMVGALLALIGLMRPSLGLVGLGLSTIPAAFVFTVVMAVWEKRYLNRLKRRAEESSKSTMLPAQNVIATSEDN